ncbi:MAG: DUF1722 domain-containing protein [Desulfurivibrionaceae bacterium]
MRIWDINPGYLNRRSLLGEHCEVHGIVSILGNKKKGYAAHPETIRWVGNGWALKIRHKQLSCEMALRGFKEKSPVNTRTGKGKWPDTYIDSPQQQFLLLEQKYADKEKGRIPLPKNTQQLWSQHKYSVLARDPNLYKEIGATVAGKEINFRDLSLILTESLRQQPAEGGIRNAVQHMWGYVSPGFSEGKQDIDSWPLRKLLIETQGIAMANNISYIISSTALSELMVWLPKTGSK